VSSEECSSSSLESGGLSGGVKKGGRKALTERFLEDIEGDDEAHLSLLFEEVLPFSADDSFPRGDIKGGESMDCAKCAWGNND
jgi:hypothetical protein